MFTTTCKHGANICAAAAASPAAALMRLAGQPQRFLFMVRALFNILASQQATAHVAVMCCWPFTRASKHPKYTHTSSSRRLRVKAGRTLRKEVQGKKGKKSHLLQLGCP
jgi:hypothetical protein